MEAGWGESHGPFSTGHMGSTYSLREDVLAHHALPLGKLTASVSKAVTEARGMNPSRPDSMWLKACHEPLCYCHASQSTQVKMSLSLGSV